MQGVIDLRPMDLGDVLDGTIRVYRAAPWVLIGIYAVIAAIPLFIQQTSGQYFWDVLMEAFNQAPTAGPDAMNAFRSSDFYTAIVAYGAGSILMFFLAPIAQAAMVYAVSETILGRSVSVAESIRSIMPRAGSIILAYVLLGLVVMATYSPIILFVALAARGPENLAVAMYFLPFFPVSALFLLYISVKLLFIPHAVILDDLGAVDAFRRSWRLVAGYWLRTFGIYLLIMLIVSVIATLLNQSARLVVMGLNAIPGMTQLIVNASSGVVITVISLIVQPLTIIATTLLYYDLRIRKEGFDLLVLASAVAGDDSKGADASEQLPFG